MSTMTDRNRQAAAASLHPMALGAAIFAFVAGAFLIILWAWLVLTGEVPDYDMHPIAATLHVIAELLTGVALVAAGYALVTRKSWAHKAYLVGAGMLLYALVQAAGYYAENGPGSMVVVFVLLMVLAVFFTLRAEQ
jgi:peptidoglycan/LPS O-acetylase OafA/YrhL